MLPLFNAPAVEIVDGKNLGTGWLPPRPDLRDYTEDSSEIESIVKRLYSSKQRSKRARDEAAKAAVDASSEVDLRKWCPPIEDQGALGSCTANAAVGVIEYFENKAFGKHIDASRLFVYKTTRNLMGVTGDTGAWLRTTMGALALCGAPATQFWPYTTADPGFDEEPSAFVYAVADQISDLKYFCHDPLGANIPPDKVLQSVKKYLVAGIPSMFGFYGFASFPASDIAGGIPYPCPGEQAQWGHAVVAVGYDDKKKIKNTQCNQSTKGALLVRNSWGTGWGDKGYGWLPYEYVLNGLALDFWSLLSMTWIDTDVFHI